MKTQLWLIKDSYGEYSIVKSETIQYGGNGLFFFIGDKIVAHFASWSSFRRLPLYINQAPEEQQEQQTGRG
jgi:hypothetical protein